MSSVHIAAVERQTCSASLDCGSLQGAGGLTGSRVWHSWSLKRVTETVSSLLPSGVSTNIYML